MRSNHQKRIDQFMRLAGQELPERPVMPSPEVRVLRAKLILEEAFETIEKGLGVRVSYGVGIHPDDLTIEADMTPDMIELADGCADLSVVTIGTLSACGISDLPLLAEVDAANLRKFGPGGHRREDGKWVKPADFVPPDIAGVLREQGQREDG